MINSEGDAIGAQVEFRGFGGKARAGADSWSKVVFQFNARNRPLTFEEIIGCLQCAPTSKMPVEVSQQGDLLMGNSANCSEALGQTQEQIDPGDARAHAGTACMDQMD